MCIKRSSIFLPGFELLTCCVSLLVLPLHRQVPGDTYRTLCVVLRASPPVLLYRDTVKSLLASFGTHGTLPARTALYSPPPVALFFCAKVPKLWLDTNNHSRAPRPLSNARIGLKLVAARIQTLLRCTSPESMCDSRKAPTM